MSDYHITKNIVADPLTRGVARVQFHRPSPIVVTDATQARLLAIDPGGAGGFVAVTRWPGGGEEVVIGHSLWWVWIGESHSDNARLLRNILSTEPSKRAEGN